MVRFVILPSREQVVEADICTPRARARERTRSLTTSEHTAYYTHTHARTARAK